MVKQSISYRDFIDLLNQFPTRKALAEAYWSNRLADPEKRLVEEHMDSRFLSSVQDSLRRTGLPSNFVTK
jgi:hypothetical protein